MVGGWVASSWGPRSPRRGGRELHVPGFGSRKFCVCTAGRARRAGPESGRLGWGADAVTPAGKTDWPALAGEGGARWGCSAGGGRDGDGFRAQSEGGLGWPAPQTVDAAEGAWLAGGVGVGPIQIRPSGLRVALAEGPGKPGPPGRCPDWPWSRAGGCFSPSPLGSLFGFELPAAFPVSV